MDPEKFSCIRQVVKTVKIPLWDMYTTTEYKGIEAALDKWKRQYEKQVGGIVVNYKNVSIPSRLGFHSDRGSYAIYNVQATFDIFCPKVGEIVKGKINRVSSEHIGCLIAETINVSIRLPRDSPCGLSKYIYLDREILFEIKSFSCKPRALCVDGEITAKCIELMDEYYPVTDEFSYEPSSQAVFGDVPSDDQQVNLSILGSTKEGKKKGKKRGRDESDSPVKVVDGDSPKTKKIKTDLDLTNNIDMTQEEDSSETYTPKKVKKKKKSSTDSPKVKKSKKDLDLTNNIDMTQEEDSSETYTPKKVKKKKSSTDSPKVKKSKKYLNSTNSLETTQEDRDTSSMDTSKKAKKKKSNPTDSPKVSQEDNSSSTESAKKENKKIFTATDSPKKIKKELSSTEDESSKKKSKKKQKKGSSKEKKNSSKKKGKITASGDVLKKDKRKYKKSSKKDDKSKSSKKNKKNNKKDKSDKRKSKKTQLTKEIKSEGI